ncbi:MAG: hypothetical protein K2H04_06330 [Bacteroidaceae bacterium]|nr:hypothetical protein [Bacteroidaceae bacterium]
MEQKNLRTAFEAIRPDLEAKLSSMTLPKDSVKIQDTIVEYLNRLLDENGEYRQNLTLSEDYVLQAAISLLNAQQAMALEVVSNSPNEEISYQTTQTISEQPNKKGIKREQYPVALGGTALGGAIGAIAFGTWGGVLGSIAGTALVLYSVYNSCENNGKTTSDHQIPQTPHSVKKDRFINVKKISQILESICDSVDNLIDTYRVQIERVKDSFGSKNDSSFLADYNVIANNLEQLFQIADSDEEDKLDGLTMQIGLLRRSLSNYGMEYKNGKIIKK